MPLFAKSSNSPNKNSHISPMKSRELSIFFLCLFRRMSSGMYVHSRGILFRFLHCAFLSHPCDNLNLRSSMLASIASLSARFASDLSSSITPEFNSGFIFLCLFRRMPSGTYVHFAEFYSAFFYAFQAYVYS